jgi:hypothetical protein
MPLMVVVAFSEHGPHVGDVLLNRHREHRGALFLQLELQHGPCHDR